MDLVSSLIQTIQSLAVLMILGGMIVAFLWKAAFYVNFVLGLIVTFLLTYVVYSLNGDVGSTVFVFLGGLIASWIIAAIGGLLCVLEGFAISAFGFWGLFVAGSPGNFLSSGIIVGSIVASIFSTIISTFAGGRIISTQALARGKSGRKKSRQNGLPPKTVDDFHDANTEERGEAEKLPEKKLGPNEWNISANRSAIVNREEILEYREQVLRQLDNLNKEAANGTISKNTANKLRVELELELKQVDGDLIQNRNAEMEALKNDCKNIEDEISGLDEEINALTSERTIKLDLLEELDARFHIEQITKAEYKNKQKELTKKIEEIDEQIEDDTISIETLKKELAEICQLSENKQKEAQKKEESSFEPTTKK